MGGVRCRCGYHVCGDDDGAAGPGRAKTPLQGGRKTVPGPSPGSARAEGEETRGSENETILVAAGPPGQTVAGLAAPPGPGGLLRHHGLPDVASASMQALRWLTETTSSLDPTQMMKEQGPQHRTEWGHRKGAGEGGQQCLGAARERGRRGGQLAAPQAGGDSNYAC